MKGWLFLLEIFPQIKFNDATGLGPGIQVDSYVFVVDSFFLCWSYNNISREQLDVKHLDICYV